MNIEHIILNKKTELYKHKHINTVENAYEEIPKVHSLVTDVGNSHKPYFQGHCKSKMLKCENSKRAIARTITSAKGRQFTKQQGCSPKKEVGGRLKQDLDKDLQLHRILILLY